MPSSLSRSRFLSALSLAFSLLIPRAGICQAPGSAPAGAAAASHGFAPERLARIDTFLQAYVDSNRIAGAVALVMRDGDVVYERAVGWADREAQRRMTPGAMFRIASQSKALTSVAIMMLVEQGRIALSDPVSRFIPAYAHTTVAVTADSVVPAKRPITIRNLLTHTSGISYGTDAIVASRYSAVGLGPEAGYGWYTADKNEPICATMERLASVPFVRQPGEAWVYGYSSDILGCVVERASGMTLDEFIHERIARPLRMTDTYFYVPASSRERLVAVYASDSIGHFSRAPEGPRGQGHYIDGPRRSFSGGAGLVSTARDYGRFLQMLLNGGELNGARILAPRTVQLMTTNQVDTLFGGSGMGFGLGFSVVQRVGADDTPSPVGTFGWGGAYGSTYRVDPADHLVIVFMLNQLPNRTDVAGKFPNLVYQALVR
ncbi:MAG TPA: serine hydrolase domain-containing protein [Gemmatimonadaceae bacterium]|nr:serine hydrolase domain-containing protein [Gemmatimonadaceae bacterium]